MNRDTNNLRVCIVSPLFHPNLGGSARQAYTMASCLGKKGIVLKIITRRIDIEIPEGSGVDIHCVKSFVPGRYSLSDFTFLNLLISLSFSLGAALRLFIWRKRFDVVQFYGASLPLLVCLPLLKMLKKKVIAKISGAKAGMEVGSIKGFVLGLFLRKIFSLTDRFIVISDELKERVLSEGFSESKLVKITNGVDAAIFSPLAKDRREELRRKFGFEGKKVFLYSGRIVNGKGLEQLMLAMTEVVKENMNVMLVLLGSGDLESRLRRIAREKDIEHFIKFEGLIKNVPEYLNAADFFVFPSLSEGMPNALLEAMSCGLPIVASRIGGVVDVIEDGKSGILFNSGNEPELASAMIGLLRDEKLRKRLGEEARKRIVESFSIDRIADEYVKLYKGIRNS